MKQELNKMAFWDQFLKSEEIRKQKFHNIPPKLEAVLDNCSYIIHSEFGKSHLHKNQNIIPKKPNKNYLSAEFREAYKTLSREEKLHYFVKTIKIISEILTAIEGSLEIREVFSKLSRPKEKSGILFYEAFSRSFSIGSWKHKKLRLDQEKKILYAERDEKIKTYFLKDYLMRRSKNKDYHSFVFEAINKNPHEKSRTVHLGFKSEEKFHEFFNELQEIFEQIRWDFILDEFETNKKIPFRNMSNSYTFGVDKSSKINQTLNFQSSSNQFNFSFSSEKGGSFKNLSKSQFYAGKSDSFFQRNQQPINQQFLSLETVTNQERFQDQLDEQNEFHERFQSSEEEERSNSENERGNEELGQQKIFSIRKQKTLIESIASIDPQLIEELTEQDRERFDADNEGEKQNIFHRLVPEYDIKSFNDTVNFGNLLDEENLKIFGDLSKSNRLKLRIQFQDPTITQTQIMGTLINSRVNLELNNEIEENSLKTLIKSENSAMMYMKLRAYNKLYRARDFVFLRHLFQHDDTLFMIDKSIENINYPPFTTIVRGDFMILWGAYFDRSTKTPIFAGEIIMNHQGYLSDAQNLNLILKFLKGFKDMEKIILKNRKQLSYFNTFSENWHISSQKSPGYELKEQANKCEGKKVKKKSQKEKEEEISGFKKKKSVTEDEKKIIKSETHHQQFFSENQKKKQMSEQSPFKVLMASEREEKGQLSDDQVENEKSEMKKQGEIREVDESGFVIISQKYLRVKHQLSPLEKTEMKCLSFGEGHPIWRGNWVRDNDEGSIQFINQKKINDQKGVLSFILAQIGKNIFSGKSVMNISLPVDIFTTVSNLELLAYSLTYSPLFLEPAYQTQSALQRLKKVTAFGLSNSILYLNMEKPFNPILGQTFQAWINGCPIYSEQISHHPPIAAVYYAGRGYTMSAQLQSKIQLHLNRGCGVNDGIFKITFDDGMECSYTTPGGELSGITFGDRKFNIIGKSYYWIQSEGLFLELTFNPTGKGFFSVGKQAQPVDYFEGTIYKVKQDFLDKFVKKKKSPTEKDIIEKYGKIHGIWNLFMNYDQQLLFDVNKEFPAVLDYEPNPLPSDSNWREDIEYRKLGLTSKAQNHKERLQVLQRSDRKLREKFSKKK